MQDYKNFRSYVCKAYQGSPKPKACTFLPRSTQLKRQSPHQVCFKGEESQGQIKFHKWGGKLQSAHLWFCCRICIAFSLHSIADLLALWNNWPYAIDHVIVYLRQRFNYLGYMELNTPFKLVAQQMETILSIFNSVLAVFTQPRTSNQGPEHPLSIPDIWKMNMNSLMSRLERISPGKLKLAGNQGINCFG